MQSWLRYPQARLLSVCSSEVLRVGTPRVRAVKGVWAEHSISRTTLPGSWVIYYPNQFLQSPAPLCYPNPPGLPRHSLLRGGGQLLWEGGALTQCFCLRPSVSPVPTLHHPPFSQHPSQLIAIRINPDKHLVYFHNVVSCPYSNENIFAHFRVLVTQFIAIYSRKADSNSTSKRKKGVGGKTDPLNPPLSLRAGNQNGNAWNRFLLVIGLGGGRVS